MPREYELEFSTPASRYLRKLKDKDLKRKFKEAIEEIRANPLTIRKSGDLAGLFAVDLSHPGGAYRIAYEIDETEHPAFIEIILIGPRENFYDELKRYRRG